MSGLTSVEHYLMKLQTFLLAVKDVLLCYPSAKSANLLPEPIAATFVCVTGGYKGDCHIFGDDCTM